MTVDQAGVATFLLFVLLMAAFGIGAVTLNSMVSPESKAENSPLVEVTCYECHVRFGMTRVLRDQRLKDHATFHCPNGHGQIYK